MPGDFYYIINPGILSRKRLLAYPLLATKFYVPTLRPGVISRPRLLERFGTSLRHKLILVSAPAGFGKTTAINEWIAGLSGSVAWLSLDMGDNDPIRFWTYLIAALQTVQPGLGESAQEMLHNPQPLPLEAILTALINEIASSPKTLVLVLDDYHQIEAQAVHDGLIFLLENQPQNFHLVVAGRSDPPWPLARLRGRQEVAEFREQDLRFDAEETTAFLNRSMHLDLSEVDILALKEHTEGWIAGLQMAALSLRGQDDAHRFVTSFTASNRFIFDYLIEEVLRKQSAEVQDFLLKTSILDQLCGPLCDAVLERANSQQVLEYLDRAHLFLTPLDDQRNWYRYHHLFADLLRGQLEKNLPEHADLHRRACGWLEARGFSANALGHAL